MERSFSPQTIVDGIRWVSENILLPRSFVALKYRMFFILVGSLLVDFGLKLNISSSVGNLWPNASFEITGPDIALVISCIIALTFLVGANLVLRIRQQSLHEKLLELMNDPNISPEIKRTIIETIVRGDATH